MAASGPNLFLVGAPRCGTTTLHGYLEQHPQVFMTRVKEPHHFCSDLREECDAFHGQEAFFPFRRREDYLALFADAGDAPVRGESSVYYLYSRTAAEEIAELAPDARILIALREPVAFLHSLHARLRSMGDEDRWTLREALALEEERAAGRELPETVRLPSFLQYRACARFSEQVQRYVERFGRERVKVVVFDDLRADEQAVVGEVLDWLGVERMTLPRPEDRNPSHEVRWLRLVLVSRWIDLRRMELAGRPGAARVQRALLNRLAAVLERVNRRAPRPRAEDPELDSELREGFRPEVERLSGLLGRDLVQLWGY